MMSTASRVPDRHDGMTPQLLELFADIVRFQGEVVVGEKSGNLTLSLWRTL